MAKIGVYNETQSSFTCYVYDLDLSYTNDNNRYVEWFIYLNGSYFAGPIISSTIDAAVYEGGYTTISGLKSNTTYVVYAYIYYNNGQNFVEPEINPITATTLSGSSAQAYNIIMSVNPSGAGSTTVSQSSATPGSLVTIGATAKPGYTFLRWDYYPTNLQIGNSLSAQTAFIMPSSTVFIDANFAATTQTRPDKFSWTKGTYNPLTGCKEKVKGSQFDLTAEEWQGLYDNINKVRVYKNLAEYDFYGNDPPVAPGYIFYFYLYNRAVFAIQTIDSSGAYCQKLYYVESNKPVMAEQLNNLMYAINEIQ